MNRKEKLTKSKERVSKHGEVFTPSWLVKDMCDMVQNQNPNEDLFDIHKTFLEPSFGTGNFLVEILKRKLDRCRDTNDCLIALGSIYGVELLPDNVSEAKQRLLDIFIDCCGHEEIAIEILDRNLICGSFLTGLTSDGKKIWFLEDCNEYLDFIKEQNRKQKKKSK